MISFGFQRTPDPPAAPRARPGSYDRDFYRWTEEQVRLLRNGDLSHLDIENLLDEVEALGRSSKRAIESRLNVLVLHLLKWRFQPEQRSASWRGTILEQRSRLGREIAESPSLRAYPAEVLADEYRSARLKAAGETGLAEEMFPDSCPFAIDDILNPDFLPETE